MAMFYISLQLGGGYTERYNETGETPAEAAKKALKKHEKSIASRLQGATGSYKRALEGMKVPRLVEVHDGRGEIVDRFSTLEI
jgi:hypothetical protein